MTEDPEVLALKQDPHQLLQVFGFPKLAYHNPCPFCGDKSALSTFVKKNTTMCFFKCHHCGEAGTVFEALIKLHGCTFREAKQRLLGKLTKPLPKPVPPQPQVSGGDARPVPMLDQDRAKRMIDFAHNFLIDNLSYVKEYKRGLSKAVIEKYRIGLIVNQQYRLYDSGKPHHFNATWVIPVTDEEGTLNGVKLHHQIKPLNPKGEEVAAKCTWAPFGTEPRADFEKGIQPVHSYYTLWPHPATLDAVDNEVTLDPKWWIGQIDKDSDLYDRWYMQLSMEQNSIAYALGVHVDKLEMHQLGQAFDNAYTNMGKEIRRYVQKLRGKAVREEDSGETRLPDPDEYIFLCPGELKALALESEGLAATSVTGGESWMPTAKDLNWFRGRRVCLPYDDDIPIIHPKTKRIICAGKIWARKFTQALQYVRAKEIIAIPGGQKIVGRRDPPKEVSHEEEDFTI